MKKYFRFPELILPLLIPFAFLVKKPNTTLANFDELLFPLLGIAIPMIVVSWILHLLLRIRHNNLYPSFGSWCHVGLTTICWAVIVYTEINMAEIENSNMDPVFQTLQVAGYLIYGHIAIILFTVFQFIFWVVAIRRLVTKTSNP